MKKIYCLLVVAAMSASLQVTTLQGHEDTTKLLDGLSSVINIAVGAVAIPLLVNKIYSQYTLGTLTHTSVEVFPGTTNVEKLEISSALPEIFFWTLLSYVGLRELYCKAQHYKFLAHSSMKINNKKVLVENLD